MKQKFIHILFGLFVRFVRSYTIGVVHTDTGISTLLCHRDVDRYIFSISSLFFQLRYILPLYVVDDGSLTENDCRRLRKYFSVYIERSHSAAQKVNVLTKKYGYLHKFRFDKHTGVFKKKLDAYLLCPFDRFIYLDSDILFFQEPKKIAEWINKKIDRIYYTLRREDLTTFSSREAIITQYSFRKLLYIHTQRSTHPLFIAGFLCIPQKNALDLSRLNSSIRTLYKFSYELAALAEETAVAMSLGNRKVTYLPIDEYININCMVEYEWSHTVGKKVFIHYSGDMKFYLFEFDAIKMAIYSRFFRR